MPPKEEKSANDSKMVTPVTMLQTTNVPEFNPNVESWNVWKERLKIHFCEVNCTDDNVRKSILLKSIGAVPYKVLHSLCSPATPVSKSFKELCEILDTQYTPPTIVFSERKIFHISTKQESESVAEWYARVKMLALNCKFGVNLDAFVLNQFVMGLPNFIFERLCEEDENLTIQSALRKAMILETKCIIKGGKEETAVNFVKKQKHQKQNNGSGNSNRGNSSSDNRGNGGNSNRGKWGSSNRGSGSGNSSRDGGRDNRGDGERKFPCSHCGWRNHASQSCKYKDSKCHSCGRVGHLASVCYNKKRSVNYVSNDNDDEHDNNDLFNYSIFSVAERNSFDVYSLPVVIDGVKLNAVCDTGAPCTLLPLSFYENNIMEKTLRPCNIPYVDYSGDRLKLVGEYDASITFKGFGMLESGCVSIKNEVNIMMKNVIDIVLGGFTYWLFGYGMSYGRGPLSNPFIAVGDFLLDPPVGDPLMGQIFAAFLFQLSFATTATTIVSGAMAERCNFKAYCLFSLLNTAVYCIPAGWVWGEHGFLNNLGAVDIAGSGPVHLIGGAAAFASAAMLGPRLGRYSDGYDPLPLGNPVNACMGLFVLWWGWLAFNSGSTYGVSGAKWQYAARAAVMTMMGSFGGGIISCAYSLWRHDGRMDIIDLINGVLGSLVSITAGCFLYRAWEALIIGMLGALLCVVAMPLFDRLGVDDPVGASSVHGVCGIWGVIAVGFFADNPVPLETTKGRSGLFKGGGWYLVGIQSLSALCLACWGICSTFLLLYIVNKFIPLRMDPNEELLGADLMEHRIRHSQIGLSRAISALAPIKVNLNEIAGIQPIGLNPGHEKSIEQLRAAENKLLQWQQYLEQMGPHLPKHVQEQFAAEEHNILKTIHNSPDLKAHTVGNVFSRKLKSVHIKKDPDRNVHTDITQGFYKPNNNELPVISTKQIDKDTNFAWVD